MKYWLLTTEYPSLSGNNKGSYWYHWSHVLHQKGAEVTVFIADKTTTKITKRTVKGIRYIEFPVNLVDTSAFLGYDTMVSYSFAEVVQTIAQKEGTPDWIEAQDHKGIAYFLLQKKHLQYVLFKDMKVIVHCHNPFFLTFGPNHLNAYQFPWFWMGEMEKSCLQAADVLTTSSRYLAHSISSAFALNKTFHIINNPYPANTQFQHSTHTELKIALWAGQAALDEITEVIGYFKQLWQEGHTYKLQIIADANHFYPAIDCTLGELIQKKYSAFVKKEWLQITSAGQPELVQAAFKTARAVIFPGAAGNSAYTFVECMAAGKIVLTARQHGYDEMIEHGESGFLYDHNAPASFMQQVRTIFSLTPQREQQIGKTAIKAIQTACDPDLCYQAKMKVLKAYKEPDNSPFPFIRSFPVTETANRPQGINDLLSVIIPFHNLGQYIDEAIETVFASDYTNLEIIIVDDGSDDKKSLKVLERLKSNERITVIHQSNQGLSATRNYGAQKARGAFIAFLDADDKVHKTYFSKSIKVLQHKKNVHFVGCWVQYFEESSGIWAAMNPEPPLLLYHNMINSGSLVYRKEAFMKAGINDPQFIYGIEDFDSVINMVRNGYHGVAIPEPLFFYRIRKNSMARAFNRNSILYLYQLLAEKHKEFYATFTTEITNLLNANGPGYKFDNPTMEYHLYKDDSTYVRIKRKLAEQIKQPQLRKAASMFYKKYINKV